MSVWVTGDIHGDPKRLSNTNFPEQKQFRGGQHENVVVILGDFGLVWNDYGEDKNEQYWLEWLEQRPFTTIFVDGNHENHVRLKEYPEADWHGGKVHVIRPHVLHLMRGEIYDIEGYKFFAFGGAESHDISDGILDPTQEDWRAHAAVLRLQGKYLYRVKGMSWWEEEMPTETEMKYGRENLTKVGNKVDFIISHSPSTRELMYVAQDSTHRPNCLTDFLEEVKSTVEYGKHFFGHMHQDCEVDPKSECIYYQLKQII